MVVATSLYPSCWFCPSLVPPLDMTNPLAAEPSRFILPLLIGAILGGLASCSCAYFPTMVFSRSPCVAVDSDSLNLLLDGVFLISLSPEVHQYSARLYHFLTVWCFCVPVVFLRGVPVWFSCVPVWCSCYPVWCSRVPLGRSCVPVHLHPTLLRLFLLRMYTDVPYFAESLLLSMHFGHDPPPLF